MSEEQKLKKIVVHFHDGYLVGGPEQKKIIELINSMEPIPVRAVTVECGSGMFRILM